MCETGGETKLKRPNSALHGLSNEQEGANFYNYIGTVITCLTMYF